MVCFVWCKVVIAATGAARIREHFELISKLNQMVLARTQAAVSSSPEVYILNAAGR